jgi:GR25 family glycosyltransferase involved in LPS biosynthesis
MVENNVSHAIVFEDDCVLSPEKFWSNIELINNKIPNDAHMFLYNAVAMYRSSTVSEYIRKVTAFWSTQFYLITLSGAKVILEKSQVVRYQIDAQLSLLSHKYINIYGFNMYGPHQNLGLTSSGNFGTVVQNLPCNSNVHHDDDIFRAISS